VASPSTFRRILTALLVSLLLGATAATAGAYPGAPWFEPDAPYDQNFPDPAIILVDDTYYAYATTTGGSSLPVMTSPDLVTWTARGDALGTGPAWSPSPSGWNIWAPTVVELPDGGFLAAFAARTGNGARRCIATARASSPLGPFTTAGSEPFVCEPDPNGALDPFLLVDDGVPWLVWKNEGVPVGHPTLPSRRTGFWSRALTDDGADWRPGSVTNFLVETTELARPWQGTVIENPALVAWDGAWFLAYSANQFDSTAYATGWARCASPAGPCEEPSTQPLLVSNDIRLGPGGPAPFVDRDGVLRLGYHGWNPPFADYRPYPACASSGTCEDAQRTLFIDAICVAGDRAFVYTPHDGPFCDVGENEYYTTAVGWLAANEITTGISPNAYGATGSVTRAQMATFLWRLMGEPTTSDAPGFVDVGDGRYYDDAVAWLASAGITTGVAPDRFDPDGLVTRAQMAAFLWRLVDEPEGPVTSGFTDVPAGRWFAPAVAWLADSGVTTGIGPGIYAPDDVVSRAQMAAFLCRLTAADEYTVLDAPTPAC
jgi:Glycosyl hydrolases family 43/S-layer homology domain